MAVSYIYHKGKKIMYIDYSNCKTTEETLKVLEQVRQEYLKTNGMMITLSDFTGGYGSKEFMSKATQLGKELFNQRTSKTAAIGVTAMKKVLINSYNMFVTNKLHVFDAKEQALDFLAT